MKQNLIDLGLVVMLVIFVGLAVVLMSGCNQKVTVTSSGGGVDNSQPVEEEVVTEEEAVQ